MTAAKPSLAADSAAPADVAAEMRAIGVRARAAARRLALATTAEKNAALAGAAASIRGTEAAILAANAVDVANARKSGNRFSVRHCANSKRLPRWTSDPRGGKRPARQAARRIMTVRAAPLGEVQNIQVGIGLMVLGFLLFSLNDALGKYLAGTYSPGTILLFRSIFALLILAPFVFRHGYRNLFSVERPARAAGAAHAADD